MAGAGAIEVFSGRTILAGDSSAFAGSTTVDSGILQVNGALGGTMDVLAAGRLEGNGIVGTTSNAGVVAPGNSIGTLTVAGDYVGDGGVLETEVVLGDDSSPTDLLVVTGNSSGNTLVDARNQGGQGAATVEGIRIVQVDGASPGSFR
jgi:fibronectin-binding autotransporter adhesin